MNITLLLTQYMSYIIYYVYCVSEYFKSNAILSLFSYMSHMTAWCSVMLSHRHQMLSGVIVMLVFDSVHL